MTRIPFRFFVKKAKVASKAFFAFWKVSEFIILFILPGTIKVFNSNYSDVFNVGSEEQVSINQLANYIEDIAKIKIDKKYLLDKNTPNEDVFDMDPYAYD